MKCSDVQNLLSAYFDNELPAEMHSAVDKHLGQCAECSSQLAQFEKLSSLAAQLPTPETPASVWAGIEKTLDLTDAGGSTSGPSEKPVRLAPPFADSSVGHRRGFRIAAAIAATVLVAFVGWTVWNGDHENTAMAEMMEQVSREIDSEGATTLLLNRFGGNEVSWQQASAEVGYLPIASKGLPSGYSVESIQVLHMPCCKCTQTACRRTDGTRLFVYEHSEENTGWFGHRESRKKDCCGKSCTVVQLDNRLAVTWGHDKRHVTLLGVRDEEEYELLVMQFEQEL